MNFVIVANAIPYPALLLYNKYKMGYGIISLQAKESKHSGIKYDLTLTNRSRSTDNPKYCECGRERNEGGTCTVSDDDELDGARVAERDVEELPTVGRDGPEEATPAEPQDSFAAEPQEALAQVDVREENVYPRRVRNPPMRFGYDVYGNQVLIQAVQPTYSYGFPGNTPLQYPWYMVPMNYRMPVY
ncbi:hypothetical protein QZH41_005089 [Actinostola sp. cb2023]|nr:hypothetical protein QZH41_005089 [Actinostola sp. cb2023]